MTETTGVQAIAPDRTNPYTGAKKMMPRLPDNDAQNLRLLNADELATMLGVSRRTIYNWTEKGDLPKPTIPGFWWADDCLRHLQSRDPAGQGAEAELRLLVDEIEQDRRREKPRFQAQHRSAIWRRVRALNAQVGKATVARLDAIQDAAAATEPH